jgi:hypothetical protein
MTKKEIVTLSLMLAGIYCLIMSLSSNSFENSFGHLSFLRWQRFSKTMAKES